MKTPRILVFTVTSWNSKVGANTWESLLQQFDSSCIASVSIREEIPDSKTCSRYFIISENRIIKSLINRKIKTGYEVKNGEQFCQKDLDEHVLRYSKLSKKRKHLFLLAREIIWKLGKWKTKELDDFLESFKPDIILHSMDGYIHLNRIVKYAIKKTGAKSIGYIWDDNFTYKQMSGLGFYIYRFFQRKSLIRLAKCTNEFFAITNKTKLEADSFFGIESYVLTKPLNSIPTIRKNKISKPIKIIYSGNLLYGRKQSLFEFLRVLSSFNEEFKLDVYTTTHIDDKEIKEFKNSCFEIHKPIPQSEIIKKQKEANILLYLESIEKKDFNVARLSFSTKITDYLSAGKAIFAVGNISAAPIEYFLNTNSAIVASNPDEIKRQMQNIVNNYSVLDKYSQSAIDLGIKNHNPKEIEIVFNKVIEKALVG